MKTAIITIAVVAIGAGSAMARGPEVGERVGAFQKGGPGVVVQSERRGTPDYRLTGSETVRSEARQETTPQWEATAEKPEFKANHVHRW